MFIGIAFTEAIAIYALVVSLILLFVVWVVGQELSCPCYNIHKHLI
jgi:hypothetical protein